MSGCGRPSACKTRSPVSTGATISFAAASGGGDTATWYSDLCIHVRNGGVGSINVTIDVPGTCNFGAAANAAHDTVIAVAAGAEKIIFVGDEKFRQDDGTVAISYSGTTTVTVGAFRG